VPKADSGGVPRRAMAPRTRPLRRERGFLETVRETATGRRGIRALVTAAPIGMQLAQQCSEGGFSMDPGKRDGGPQRQPEVPVIDDPEPAEPKVPDLPPPVPDPPDVVARGSARY
jgi:hypothetical protein